MEKQENKSGGKKAMIIAVIILAVAAAGFAAFRAAEVSKPRKIDLTTSAVYESINEKSELEVFTVPYVGITEVRNEEKPEKIDYYLKYSARLTFKVDFSKIKVESDEENKSITVTLPPVVLDEPEVYMETIEYIANSRRKPDAGETADFYRVCNDDIAKECKKQDAMLKLAEENLRTVITNLTEPMVSASGMGYALKVI